MDYTVQQLSALTGLTPRTLRYYDAIGLLRPGRDAGNDYRRYGPEEVDRLEQILLYRSMGLPLGEIKRLLDDPTLDRAAALEFQLRTLQEQRDRLDAVIETVSGAVAAMRGEQTMTDQERFERTKAQALAENEAKYGAECRARYGEEAMAAWEQHAANMTEAQWQETEQLSEAYLTLLRRAMKEDDPAGETARETCRLHRTWLERCWGRPCPPRAQLGMGELYTQDPRFAAYYDEKAGPGGAAFLARAIRAFCEAE